MSLALEAVFEGACEFLHSRRRLDEASLFTARDWATRETLDAFLLHLDLAQQLRISPDPNELARLASLGDWLDFDSGLLVEHQPHYSSKHPKVHEMAGVYLSFQASGVCQSYGIPMPVLDHCECLLSPPQTLEVLESMPWQTSPWGAGGWLDALATMARGQLEHGSESLDESLAVMAEFLRNTQDVESGVWGSEVPQGLIGQLNGAYHAVRCLLVPPFGTLPRCNQMAETVVSAFATDHYFAQHEEINACNELDFAKLLSWIVQRVTPPMKHKLRIIADFLLERLLTFQNADGGYGFFGHRCADTHNYLHVAVQTPRVSDIQGTVFVLEAIRSLVQVTDGYARVPWGASCTHG